MYTRYRSSILVLLIAMCAASSAFAALGKLAGVVRDTDGKALPGVVIKIEGLNKGATTDAEGRFFILNVPPGSYSATASLVGYRAQTQTGIGSASDVTTPVNYTLETAPVEVGGTTITAIRPLVDKTLTSTRTIMGAAELNNALPVDNVNGIIETAASVYRGRIRGGNARETKVLLDGVNISDPYFAGADGQGSQGNAYTLARRSNAGENSSVTLNTSGMQEIVVLAGTFNAEYDAASAGLIKATTRSGGASISVDEFFRTSLGGLDHQGPDVYYNPISFGDGTPDSVVSDAVGYMVEKGKAQESVIAGELATHELSLFVHNFDTSGGQTKPYSYGDDPTFSNEIAVGGPLGSMGNFFVTNRYYQSNGRFPNEFSKSFNTSVKFNLNVTDQVKLTLYGQVDDGGGLGLIGDWNNRTFSQRNKFYLQNQPANKKLGYTSYLKLTHSLSPKTFVELRLSTVGREGEYGFAGVNDSTTVSATATNENFNLIALNDDGDLLNLPNGIASGMTGRYVSGGKNTPFNPQPGNTSAFDIFAGGNAGFRLAQPGYYYELLTRGNLGVSLDVTSQVNFHNLLKAGVQYKRLEISQLQKQTLLAGQGDPLGFELVDYTLNPVEYGFFVQDRIEYQGVIINAGIRLDGFDYNAKDFGNPFLPTRDRKEMIDTTGDGLLDTEVTVSEPNRNKDVPTKWFVSPRLGISHPISDNAAMHYSWAKLVNPPLYSYLFDGYNISFGDGKPSLPSLLSTDQRPIEATAYEIGMQVAFADVYSVDVTAFYRDMENTGRAGFSITPDAANANYGSFGIVTDAGGSVAQGFEVTISKAPDPGEKMINFSGRLAYSFSTVEALGGGGGANNPSSFAFGTDPFPDFSVRENFDYTLRRQTAIAASAQFNSSLTGYDRTHKINIVLQAHFPAGLSLSTTSSIASGFLYPVTELPDIDPREQRVDEAPWTWQTDVRLEETQQVGPVGISVFAEIRNLLDRKNILTFDRGTNFAQSKLIWERDQNPHGNRNLPTRWDGAPLYDIAREVYAGIRLSF